MSIIVYLSLYEALSKDCSDSRMGFLQISVIKNGIQQKTLMQVAYMLTAGSLGPVEIVGHYFCKLTF